MPEARKCPGCGEPVADNAAEGLCPKCLMRQGLATEPLTESDFGPERPRELPKPGEQFGGYRIVRELGRGGMGAVFEAEHLESGRNVALKVLSRRLDSSEDRKRFLREGRLAASINHPNSVYVYGTEEIDGTPAIAMELVAGGTLQERVQRRGPFPVPEAVDAIMQAVAGLEAAQALGILHRDIKPSNCFQDADGTTKIGDFGLSISTAPRGETDLTMEGAFLGTPAFCSPEQLRGEELNARSDMYSVGVTLFYLLTGHTPFEGKSLVQLVANVLAQRPPSPRKFKPEIPHGLVKAVLRCLEKQPSERFKNYEELREALAPYSSAAPTPATLSLRCVAGLCDTVILGITGSLVVWLTWGNPMGFMNATMWHSPGILWYLGGMMVFVTLYYALTEGLWGATLGKALCRVRVIGPDRNPPGLPRALVRALIYGVLPGIPYWLICGLDPVRVLQNKGGFTMQVTGFMQWIVIGLLFCTVRRRNGFAAVHDLLTNTRVILRTSLLKRPVPFPADEPLPVNEASPMIGPYHILETLEQSPSSKWLLGYDLRLLRQTWVHVVAPGTPPIAPQLRNLGRIGRLRWIAGRRSTTENWDAFEAVTGKPLVVLMEQPQPCPWSQVRYWLMDLAREITVGLKDGTLPAVLALDRVWITGDGRAKLLDFPAPGTGGAPASSEPGLTTGAPPTADRFLEARNFLDEVARAALAGTSTPSQGPAAPVIATPLPLRAREFLGRIAALASPDAIVAALAPLLQSAPSVSRWRRLGVIAACAAFPAIAGIGALFGLRMVENLERDNPGVMQMSQLLQQHSSKGWYSPKNIAIKDDQTVGVYLSAHYQSLVTNATTWSNIFVIAMIQPGDRQFAERSVAEHPNPTPDEIHAAEKALKPFVTPFPENQMPLQPWMSFAVVAACLLMYVCVPALIAALLFRGGLVLRGLGLAVVRRDGTPASRLRMLWRGLVAWSPALAAPVIFGLLYHSLGPLVAALVTGLLLVVLIAWSLALPERSLQDRLAGTWLVPR